MSIDIPRSAFTTCRCCLLLDASSHSLTAPLFIEELTKPMGGPVAVLKRPYRRAREFTGVVTGCLDRMPDAKQVAQVGAVIGELFANWRSFGLKLPTQFQQRAGPTRRLRPAFRRGDRRGRLHLQACLGLTLPTTACWGPPRGLPRLDRRCPERDADRRHAPRCSVIILQAGG